MARILITADWHIRGERPLCRTDDDWIDAQRENIKSIRGIFEQERCKEMWIIGDLFDQHICATEAVCMLMDELSKFPKDSVKVLPGNHDLLGHSIDNLGKSSIGVVTSVYGSMADDWVNAHPFGLDDYESMCPVACTHQLVFPDKDAIPFGAKGLTAEELLSKFKNAKFIFTGDYHHAFIHMDCDGRYVVNPGCINVQKADMIDYEPSCVIFDDSEGLDPFKTRMIPQPKGVVTRDHIEEAARLDGDMAEVVERIEGVSVESLDFDSNLEDAVSKMDEPIQRIHNELKEKLTEDKK